MRALPPLRENTTGAFYVKSRGFLHFHEEGEDIFADVRLGDDWTRLRVTTRAQQDTLMKKVRKHFATL
jgi:hypothetical protein